MNSLDAFARRLSNLERQVRASNKPRLANSTIEDGALRERDRDGNLRGQYGLQFDGTHAPLSMGGPVPPTPNTPTMAPAMGGIRIDWDGTFVADAIVPMDFTRVEVHVSADEEMTATTAETLVGTIETPRGAGIILSVAASSPPQYVRLVCRTMSGGLSEASVIAGPASPLLVTAADIGASVTELTTAPLVWGLDPPNTPVAGQLWLNTADNTLWRWSGTEWIAETVEEAVNAALAAMVRDDIGSAGQHPALIASQSIVARTIIADLIKANQIQADHLAAVLVLATTIIAGTGLLADHVSLSSTGFRVNVFDPDQEVLYEAIKLGTGADDYFAITDAAGVVKAAINALGDAQFRGLSLGQWPDIAAPDHTGIGGSLDQILDRRPRAFAGYGVATATGPTTSSSIGFFEVGAILYPGRAYRIRSSFRMKSTVADDLAEVQIRYTSAALGTVPAQPLISSSVLARAPVRCDPTGRIAFVEKIVDDVTATKNYRLLLSYSRISGTGSVSMHANATDEQVQFTVEDIGPKIAALQVINDGGGSGGALPTLQTLSTVANWTNAYNGSGALRPTQNNAWQGNSIVYGMRKSMIGFPEMTVLTGKTIESVVLKLFAKSWTDVGGTAVIGFHEYLTQPAGALGTLYTANVLQQAWSDVGYGYVDLTAYAKQEWATGAKRGIYLGFAAGVEVLGNQNSGHFAGALEANATVRPELVVTYLDS